jgi:hypothetical protein
VKAHQRLIREQQQIEESHNLFGKYWEKCNVDIKSAVFKEISSSVARNIIEKYEWLGTMGTTQYHYGIFFDNICAGVVCFGYFQSMFNENNIERGGGYSHYVGKYWDKGIQLTRGACVHWAHPHSGSKLIAFGLKEMDKMGYKFVLAFSDPEAGEVGTLYQATNWLFIGDSGRTHYDLYHKNGKMFMNSRDFNKKFGKGGYKNKMEFVNNHPKYELILKPIYAKGRYIYLLGTKNEKKEMLDILKNKILPYPKRNDL